MKQPRSRGISGALYLKSAIAGVMPTGEPMPKKPAVGKDVDVLVLHNGALRTVSGRERSSTKQTAPCDVRVPLPSPEHDTVRKA